MYMKTYNKYMGVRDYTVLFVIPHVKKYNKKHQLISHEFFFSKIY